MATGKFGYFGKILWVDLTTGIIEKQPLPDQFYEQYIGGYALGVKILFDRLPPGSDPLGPENILGFLPGLLAGTGAPFSGRYMVVAKSPLTGTWGDANSGGFFGPAIRKCGVDGIFFTGKYTEPVYLYYDGETSSLVTADDLWGRDSVETEGYLRNKHGKSAQIATIGQAGEKCSLISCIINNKGRAAARSGLGAVMGSKNLKAVVLNGQKQLNIFNPEKLKSISQEHIRQINLPPNLTTRLSSKALPKVVSLIARLNMPMKITPELWIYAAKEQGTSVGNAICSENGDSPVKNWGGIGMYDFPQSKARKIGGDQYLKYKKKSYGCSACPLRCGALLTVPEKGITETHRPEYESSCMFGTFLLNDDVVSIMELNDMCNRAGFDTISAGSTIGFAIECFENNIITEKDTGGIQLRWGNAQAIKQMLQKMINREGFGDILADGVRKASEKIGNGADKYAMHICGQEIPAHDPKHFTSFALTYNTDPTPGRHTTADIDFLTSFAGFEQVLPEIKFPKNRKQLEEKVEGQKLIVAMLQVFNALGYCQFGLLCGKMPVFETLEAVTGWNWDKETLIQTGLRIQNLRWAFNLREGINLSQVTLPGRVSGEITQKKGPNKGIKLDVKHMKRSYFKLMGWDPHTGIPKKDTLRKLDLDFVIDQIMHQ